MTDDFNALMRDITNVYLVGMGLPPLHADPSNEPVQRDSPLWNRLRVPDVHDFRDYPQRDRPDWDLDARGNPLRPGT